MKVNREQAEQILAEHVASRLYAGGCAMCTRRHDRFMPWPCGHVELAQTVVDLYIAYGALVQRSIERTGDAVGRAFEHEEEAEAKAEVLQDQVMVMWACLERLWTQGCGVHTDGDWYWVKDGSRTPMTPDERAIMEVVTPDS